jgi:hypothetical protein
MERRRSDVSPETQAFLAQIIERPDPIWEAFVEEPRDRSKANQRRGSVGPPAGRGPRNPDDPRSAPQSSRVSPETEAFLARVTGAPSRLDTAAFVAAITGQDAPARADTPGRTLFGEHNFNPNEPRDDRGRWTTGMGVAGQGGHSVSSDDSPYLSGPRRARKVQLARAAAELDALVAAGRISKKERDLRYEGVKAALGHKMYFRNDQDPNPAHFEKRITIVNGNPEATFHLKPGQATAGVHDRVYGISGPGTGTGCTRASQLIMLEAQAQLAKQQGKSAELDKAVTGKTLDDLYPDEQNSDYQNYNGNHKDGLDTNSFVPGDRVWMQNHQYTRGLSVAGGQGSNVIYLGKDGSGIQRFVHMDGGEIVDEGQLKKDVQGYTAKDSQDKNIDNYKFKERYSPKVTPDLGQ